MESYEDIDLKKVEKEKELQKAQSDLSTVEIADINLRREVLLLQLKRNTLQEAINKAKLNVKAIKQQVSELVGDFWRAKG